MPRAPKLNQTAVEETLRELRDQGRLGPEDEALVTLARGLAAAVDKEPGNASLWREYRAAVTALREVGADGDDDEAAGFADEVRTPLGDTPQP